MTEIQARTYDAALTGKDVLGRARTGTGKTIAFLLPAIERLLRTPEYDVNNDVGILVISPTRELATQIGDEAEKLLTFHKSLMTVQVVFGGTKTARDVSRLNKRIPTVLVATPGRLKDLLQTASVGGTKFNKIMSRTPILVLDETDQLLDLGFRREIQQILNYLGSSRKRQTLLFSATVPNELKGIMQQTMEDDYVEVDCIRDGGQSTEQTSIHVEQSHAIISSMTQYVPSIIRVVREAANDGDGDNKVVVFFPTARMVSFFADLFNEVVGLPVMELHSKKSQGYRNRVSNQFRECSSGILFTSDVSARGVDYPGVTHVVQFGMPSSKEQYIHRLGRTGRANASGKGWLILCSFEGLFLEELTKIDIPKNPELIDLLNKSSLDETDNIMQSLLERIQNGDQMLNKSGEGAYQAFLGYYLGQMKRIRMKRKERLVDIANEFSASMGFENPPVLGGNMVKKMGLDGVAGLLVGKSGGGKSGRSHTPPKRDGRSRPSSKRRRK
jgi:ATP-dependent RNA helicase MSS116